MAEIISKAVHENEIDCCDSYEHFLNDLADLICKHFGGERGFVYPAGSDLQWSAAFHVDESVPDDGGVFKNYDPDVKWINGKEFAK